MTASHKQLPIDEITPGMVLSDQICNPQGTVLLAAGTVLNEAILHSLQKYNITSLPILFETVEVNSPEKALAEQQKRLLYLFRRKPDDDASPHLLELLQQYRKQALA